MNRKKLLSLLLALVMVLSAFPISAFAAPASDIPDKMLDNPIVRALAYTGYNVQKQKDNGTIYQTGHYGGALKRNAPSILSDIHYSTSLTGKETVSDSSTVTGKAPNIARFEQYGLCCASFVTYYICNYLPNIEGVDTQFITDAINATGMNSQAVVTWQNALNKLASQGKVEKVGTSPSNVDYSKLTPGDIIIFGNSSSSHVHAAIFAGVYNGKHFIIHVGNERGPEINTTEGMAHSSNGDKASTPNGYYHLPDELFIENGFMEVKKTDENGKALAGAVFVATNQKTGKAYKIGPTNASGYAKAADPIPFGTYTVKETVFPKDYRAYGKSEWTVTLNKNTPNATITIKAVNELIPGSAKIVKVSEDGKVDGITFRIQGNGIDKTVKTANGGVIQVDNLKPGVYTVTETEYDKYIPQEVRRATVVSGQVSTVNFSNKLRRGDLTVKKTAEDGLTEGMKFRLYGTSISGIEVNEYAVTDKNGIAKFKNVLIGTGYTLEEVDTPTRYVIPDKQTAAVEWNKVTNKSFDNVLKKFNVTVTKSDSEKGLPQGDASLAGAKYGIYKGNQLIDTYTTDANGQFTTKYYICGDDWSLKEISPSEGYLLNTESQHIGAEAKLYTVEYNLTKPLDSLENVIKGKIAVIKHCDDGSTKIETPEKGAGFEVYLKAAGSYENAEETERDILVCDENGFAETKDLPYGEYIVQHINYPTHVDIDTYYTDVTGKLMMPEKLPYGNYEIIEQCTAYGYVLDSAPIAFKVDGSKTVVTVEKHNMPQKGIVNISKSGEVFFSAVESDGVYSFVFADKGLAGAVYEITAAEDIITPDGTLRYAKGAVVDTVTTDENGNASSKPLYLGKYTVRETKAPYGMVLNDEAKSVELTYAGETVEVTETAAEFYNERQKAEVSLSKILGKDETFGIGNNGEILSVQFGLYAAEDLTAADGSVIPKDGLLEVANCNENGNITFKTDIPVGAKLYVKEIATDSHYILSDEKYPVTFDYAGQDTALVEIKANGGEAIKNDILYGSVKGLKIDRETEKPVIGAKFGLFRSDKTEFTAENALLTAESGEDGVFTFENIPYGDWLIKELQPADGYLENNEIYPVRIGENGQTIGITVINDRIPKIKTTATVDGEKEICATEVFTLTDTVSYSHLIPGKEYVLKGTLMDKNTGKAFTENDKAVTAETVFTPEIPNGTVAVSFTFDSRLIKESTSLVVFETLYKDGKELAVHADIEDEDQTVKVTVPEIGTKATVNGEKSAAAKGDITIEDTISYKNLTVGKEYTVKGILMDKATGKPFLVNGKEVTSEITFTAEKKDGEITVRFNFDGSKVTKQTDIVVFETLYRDGVEIAAHADIEDGGQTVTLTPPAPPVPQMGDNSSLGFWIGLGAVALGGIIAVVIIRVKSRKDEDDE